MERKPVPLKNLLAELKRDLNRKRRSKRLDTVARRWEDVVGADVAGSTRVRDVSSGLLTIEVDSSALKAELDGFERDRLLGEMSVRVKFTRIHGIRFVLATDGKKRP